MRRGWVAPGPEVAAFERDLSARLQTEAAAAVSSGSAALPELTAATASVPSRAASSCSKALTSGPAATQPRRTTAATRSASVSSRVGRECGIRD